ncbi:MAG: FeoA family protein [Chloroflexota bacterium]
MSKAETESPSSATSAPTEHSLRALSELEAGQQGIVRLLSGGKEFTSRVSALGFIPGTEITVLENYGRGPVLVAVLETRVALGRGEANKVQVEVPNEA